jgi:tRNA G18 (ribose-2'-O)-methylase SpoU
MITNLQNEQIKELVKLQLRKGRTEAGVFLIEGVRFVEEAFKAGLSRSSWSSPLSLPRPAAVNNY